MAFCILKFIAGCTSVAINIKTITTIQIFVQDDFRGQVANSGSSERGFRYKLNIDSGSI